MTYNEVKERVMACVPTVCPECGATLTLSENLMHLTCTNPDCGGKTYRKIEVGAKALGIDNIGPSVAKEMVEFLNVTHVYQLFDLSVNDLLSIPRYQDGMANRIYSSIHALDGKDVSFPQFIRACQFRRVGDGTATELASVYPTLEDLLNAEPNEMASKMPSMTTVSSTPICESIQASRTDVLEFAKRVKIVYETTPSGSNSSGSNLTCVVTGPLRFGSRPEFQSVFGASYGIKWGSAVSKNTDILVTNETTPTGKYKKAHEIQASGGKIKIMNESEFLEFIGANPNVAEVRSEVTIAEVSALESYDGQDVNL